jgi:hypothetical protein
MQRRRTSAYLKLSQGQLILTHSSKGGENLPEIRYGSHFGDNIKNWDDSILISKSAASVNSMAGELSSPIPKGIFDQQNGDYMSEECKNVIPTVESWSCCETCRGINLQVR